MHWEERPLTPVDPAPMLSEVGVHGTILGHSERLSQYFGESDKALAQKVPVARAAGLRPVVCVGETEEERERGPTQRTSSATRSRRTSPGAGRSSSAR